MRGINTIRRHYQSLADDQDDDTHPIDAIVDALAEVAEFDRAVRVAAEEMASPAVRQHADRWRDYEDLRLQQRWLHEERFFDLGYEMGHLAGLGAAGHEDLNDAARSLQRNLFLAITSAPADRGAIVAMLLALARAVVLNHPVGQGADAE